MLFSMRFLSLMLALAPTSALNLGATARAPAARMAVAPITTGDVKVRFNEAMGKAFDVNPRHMQVPMPTQSFANEMITSTTLAMATPNYRYTRVFALGFDALCNVFLAAGCSDVTAKAVRTSLCISFEIEESELDADVAALKAATEGITEADCLALDDLQQIAAKKMTYSYIFGAGMITLMQRAGVTPDETSIARWCDALNLNCKNVLNRDYKYFESSIVKMEGMKEMMAQMEASAKRDAAKRAAAKEAAANGETVAPAAVATPPPPPPKAEEPPKDEGGFLPKMPELPKVEMPKMPKLPNPFGGDDDKK